MISLQLPIVVIDRFRQRITRQYTILEAVQTSVRGDPQAAIPRQMETSHVIMHQTLSARVFGEDAALLPIQSFLGRDPEVARQVLRQSEDGVIRETWGPPVEHRKLDSIKPRQPTARPDPQPTVTGLKQTIDRVIRQAVVGRPRLVVIRVRGQWSVVRGPWSVVRGPCRRWASLSGGDARAPRPRLLRESADSTAKTMKDAPEASAPAKMRSEMKCRSVM